MGAIWGYYLPLVSQCSAAKLCEPLVCKELRLKNLGPTGSRLNSVLDIPVCLLIILHPPCHSVIHQILGCHYPYHKS